MSDSPSSQELAPQSRHRAPLSGAGFPLRDELPPGLSPGLLQGALWTGPPKPCLLKDWVRPTC